MLPGTANGECGVRRPAALCRRRDAPPPGQKRARDRPRSRDDGRQRPRRDNLAALLAGAGTDVHQVVGRAHGGFIVLDYEHRVAQVAEGKQRGDEALLIAGMEADARLVQHVDDALQLGADLRRQTDALRLAAGKRGRRAVQGQIAQAHVGEEVQADT